MKKFLKVSGVILLLLILFRGVIYRSLISYKEINERPKVEVVNAILKEKIENNLKGKTIGFAEVIKISNEITCELLSFSSNATTNNSNELVNVKKANCIGYSAMFNSVANYIIESKGLQTQIMAQHKVAKLELLGYDVHQLFNDPFYANHDYNVIINKSNGEVYLTDPSLRDYFYINEVK